MMTSAEARSAALEGSGSPQARNTSIDVAKGIGIVLVVLGHNAAFRTGLHAAYEAIYLFHMPLFFFLSGVTFKPAPPLIVAHKRWRSLLVPYFAFNGLAVALQVAGSGPDSGLTSLAGILYGTGHALRFTPLWFLPCLFLVSVAVAIICAVGPTEHAAGSAEPVGRTLSANPAGRDRRSSLLAVGVKPYLLVLGARPYLCTVALVSTALGVALITSGWFASPPFQDSQHRPLGLPWSLDLLPLAVGCFITGRLVARESWLWNGSRPWRWICVSVLLLALLVNNDVSVDLNYRRLEHPIGALLGMISGIGLVAGLTMLFSRSRLLTQVFAYLGSASLVLLLVHGPLQRRIVDVLEGWIPEAAILAPLGSLLTIAMICAADIALVRRIPPLGWICYPRLQRQS